MDALERYLNEHKPQYTESGLDGKRLRDTAYERLKDALRYADLQPGAPLSESHLSRLLGISRTPVREALQQLVQEGLLQTIPGRAVTVASPSIQGLLNVIHVRSVLEPEVVRLVAASNGTQVVATLREILEKMDRAAAQNDRAAWSKADTAWHEALCRACPNSLLADLALQMRNRSHYASVDIQTPQQRIADCTGEHRQVVDAIAAGDPTAAERAMRRHINELRESMFRRLMHK
jgi:DNA-binding GntR family transcriptional regulator